MNSRRLMRSWKRSKSNSRNSFSSNRLITKKSRHWGNRKNKTISSPSNRKNRKLNHNLPRWPSSTLKSTKRTERYSLSRINSRIYKLWLNRWIPVLNRKFRTSKLWWKNRKRRNLNFRQSINKKSPNFKRNSRPKPKEQFNCSRIRLKFKNNWSYRSKISRK